MTRWQKYGFTVLAATSAVSGFVYFWMKYMLEADDPFAVVNHPLQPSMLHTHVLAGPALLFLFGIVFNSHVSRRLGCTVANRRSGILSAATMAVMTISGYLLQVVTDGAWQRASLIAHLASGVVFTIAYVTHLAIGVRLAARGRVADRAAA